MAQRQEEGDTLTFGAQHRHLKEAKAKLDDHTTGLGKHRAARDTWNRRSIGESANDKGGSRSSRGRLAMRDQRAWHPDSLQNLSETVPALKLDDFRLSIRGKGLRDGVKIRPRGVLGAPSKIFKVDDRDLGNRAIAAVILDSQVERDIGECLSFDSNENNREI
jgi:hypothetical protein